MKSLLKAAAVIAVAVLAVATFSYGIHIHREFQSKVEWSVLQAADLNNRQNPDAANVILYSDSAYHLAGIINTGKKPLLSDPPKVDRVWILLDAKYPPRVKVLNSDGADFRITKSELERITAYTRINPDVASVLSEHIR
jgi:hypothetical protein